MQFLQPKEWNAPRGYSNGVLTTGKMIFLAGQVGWNSNCKFESNDLVGQALQVFRNIAAILQEAGAKPEHIVRLTWFIKDKKDYIKHSKQVGEAYRTVMGKHFPAMSLVQVVDLLEDQALIEVEATAVIPGDTL